MKKKIAFISGNFNIIHAGHIRLFKFAKSIAENLIIGLYSDKLSNASYINENLRFDSLNELQIIDKCLIIRSSLEKIVKKIKPDFIIKGLEFQNAYNEEAEYIDSIDCKMVFSSGEISFSSSKLMEKIFSPVESFKLPEDYLIRHKINKSNIVKIINDFKKKKILVIGDLIIDKYINCEPTGLSREEQNLVYSYINKRKYLGGAGIVAAHASVLGSESCLITICGDDDEKLFAISKLNEYKVKHKIYSSSAHNTIVKTRYRYENNSVFRLNHLQKIALSADLRLKILNYIKKIIKNFDILIFSDFNYGCLDDILINELINLARKNNLFVAADSQTSSQFGDIGKYAKCDLITPTEYEARASVSDNQSGLVVLSEKLRSHTGVNNILLKQGKDGLFIHKFFDQSKTHLNDSIMPLNKNPVDIAGAGDSMLIASSLSMAISNDIWISALFGSMAASIQISREGNIPIQKNEILGLLQ